MEFIDPRKTTYVPVKSRGELPHLYKPGSYYFVTFRLADAVLTRKRRDQSPSYYGAIDPRDLLSDYDPPITLGSCALGNSNVASMTQQAILHFNETRYQLVAWCIMPNHVHVVFSPVDGHCPSDILRSWKGFTARAANKILKINGTFWERESFDHLIRTADSVERFADYVENNPVEAGLCDKPSEWLYSSAGSGFQSPLGDR